MRRQPHRRPAREEEDGRLGRGAGLVPLHGPLLALPRPGRQAGSGLKHSRGRDPAGGRRRHQKRSGAALRAVRRGQRGAAVPLRHARARRQDCGLADCGGDRRCARLGRVPARRRVRRALHHAGMLVPEGAAVGVRRRRRGGPRRAREPEVGRAVGEGRVQARGARVARRGRRRRGEGLPHRRQSGGVGGRPRRRPRGDRRAAGALPQ
mmetsp:Transcript_33722/g.107600  ORF Transcript_33722/g.107600 Transcript_33722/m.107600 type:complete len:208 (-) Transcript_33722:348-971(-)